MPRASVSSMPQPMTSRSVGWPGQIAGDLDPEIGMTEHGAVVDLHLAVGTIEAAVPGHHEGIDFKRLAVVLLVELGQFGEERGEFGEVCRSIPAWVQTSMAS